MKKNITIGFSTRNANQTYIEHLKKTSGLKDVEIIQVVNDGSKSLSEVYNDIIKKSSNDYIVLCHDDLVFETQNWGKKVVSHFEKQTHHIFGVAGTTNFPESARWWDDKSKMVGIVNHLHEGKKWESKYSKSYGNEIIDVCLVDGLFICLDKKNIKSHFDEEIDGFHFYDIGFCINNFLKGIKVGVIFDIRITHKSIGITNDSWEKNRKLIIEKYESKLPINIVPNIDYNLFKNKITKTNFNIIVQTNSDLQSLEILLEQINRFNIKNLKINLLSDSSNYENILKFKKNNISVFESVFDELNKNLSVLKWDDELFSTKDDLIVLFNQPVQILNDIFHSISSVYTKERNKLGCIFPLSLNQDKTIFSSGINFLMTEEKKVQVNVNDLGSYYNVLNGLKKSNYGSFSEVLISTPSILKKLDWLEVRHNSPLFFNYFAVKCIENNLNVFVDTNSVCLQKSFSDTNLTEKINSDLNDLLSYINSKEILKKKLNFNQ